ncbi:unnamed protein product [Albugo candida]|uniref:Uncharacterized protein n=1 Tax=Albugo candida TaxID=65357 RepID=A0A024GAX1_9STRA|nr:unnamed protein product [Albugo candida]|eukprot:CCI43700.1 unnamed protein product [Albugo candida]
MSAAIINRPKRIDDLEKQLSVETRKSGSSFASSKSQCKDHLSIAQSELVPVSSLKPHYRNTSQQSSQRLSTLSNTTESGQLCKYPSKPCVNRRAVKKTGKLHSFCEFHRSMANRNQRRLEQRRRIKRKAEDVVGVDGQSKELCEAHSSIRAKIEKFSGNKHSSEQASREPFQFPVHLLPEDIQFLHVAFMNSPCDSA